MASVKYLFKNGKQAVIIYIKSAVVTLVLEGFGSANSLFSVIRCSTFSLKPHIHFSTTFHAHYET